MRQLRLFLLLLLHQLLQGLAALTHQKTHPQVVQDKQHQQRQSQQQGITVLMQYCQQWMTGKTGVGTHPQAFK